MISLKSSDRLKPSLRDILDEKLQQLKSLRPISPVLLEKLKERFQVEMTYNSNGIEGNTLTLNETYWVFQEGITVKGKSLKEHLEVKDHKRALEKLYQLVESPTAIDFSEQLIKELHQAVIEQSEEADDYDYRTTDVFISGSNHKPPSPAEVRTELKKLIKWIRDEAPPANPQSLKRGEADPRLVNKGLHIIEFAAVFHHKFVHIHPFLDGNGRTTRLLMNLFLMRAGFPLVIILKNDRQKYYRALRMADNGRYKALIQFIAQAALRSINLYLDALTPAKEKDEFISLAEATKYCDYSQEYLSKLAKEGRLDAHKKSRNWVTTKKAVEEYVAKHGKGAVA
ncbi:MAG: Fic family protein [Candidatus Altimarinota bacterium]